MCAELDKAFDFYESLTEEIEFIKNSPLNIKLQADRKIELTEKEIAQNDEELVPAQNERLANRLNKISSKLHQKSETSIYEESDFSQFKEVRYVFHSMWFK